MNGEKESPTATGFNGEAHNLTTSSTISGESKLLALKAACERGCEVFPTWWLRDDGTCACGDATCANPGKHPRVKWQYPDPGRSGATSDFAQVQEWHNLWPEANWAMRLDSVFVVDVDKKHGGLETYQEYEENAPEYFPPTLTQRTSGGGLQLFYRQPPERDVHTIAQGRLPRMAGIEVKALRADGEKGSYVLIPPSYGREWLNPGTEVADPTPHLLRVIRGVKRRASSGVDGATRVEPFDWDRATEPGAVPPGEQDDTLHRAAASLRGQGVNDSTALAILRRVVDAFANDPTREPWTHEHAERKWRETKERYPDGRSQAEIAPKLREWVSQARSVPETPETAETPFVLTAAQVRERPKLRWFIEDVMPERALFQIYGQTGTYKSFAVIDLLGQVANGERGSWLGKQVLAEGPGLTVMVLGEGGGDIGERVEAWCAGNPVLSSENMLYVVDRGIDLLDQEDVNELGENLARVATERGLPLRMVIFDTQADHLPTGDERDEATFSRLKPVLLHISRELGACVGLVHHTGWNEERERGSSRQRQMMDVVMEIKDTTVTAVKVKAGPKFNPIHFKTEPAGDSLVVRPVDGGDLAELQRRNAQRKQRNVDALVSYLTNVKKDTERSQSKITGKLGVGKQTFQELIDELGPRVRTESGLRNATWYFLVPPGDETTSSGSERV